MARRIASESGAAREVTGPTLAAATNDPVPAPAYSKCSWRRKRAILQRYLQQAARDSDGVNLVHFTGGTSAEFVALRHAHACGAKSRGPAAACSGTITFATDGFDDAAVAVGLDGLTPHELRHTAASLAVSSGANVKAVQRMLGHVSAAMTLDVYSSLFDGDLDGLANRLDEAHVYWKCDRPKWG